MSATRISYYQSEGEGTFDNSFGTFHKSCFNTNWLEDPSVILDVGAFDFGDSVRFKTAFPEARVCAVEANPENYEKYSARANSAGIETYPFAMSDRVGEIQFYKSRHVGGVNAQGSVLKPGTQYSSNYSHIVSHDSTPISVPATTMDEWCEQMKVSHVDLLHLDVEGAEHLVFLGMKKIRPKIIFAEFLIDGGWEGQAKFTETLDLLTSYDYKLVRELSFDKIFIYEPNDN